MTGPRSRLQVEAFWAALTVLLTASVVALLVVLSQHQLTPIPNGTPDEHGHLSVSTK